jgi:hypothetical protein
MADIMFLENELPEKWTLLSKNEAHAMEVELAREVCQDHSLYDKELYAVARSASRDDFLFSAKAKDSNLYMVHLTWDQEESADWPTVDVFAHKATFLSYLRSR